MMATAIVALAAGALGALEWRRIARKNPDLSVEAALRHARHLLAVIPIALALLVLQVVIVMKPDVTWSAPVWLELLHVELLLGGVVAAIAFVFGLATYGAFVTRHAQRAAALISTVMVVGIVVGIEWDFTAPIASELRDVTRDGVVLQSSGASCAAASAANLARHHGVVRTEREMAELLGTTRFGTSPAQVIHGLGRLGFSCRKTLHADMEPASAQTPAVLFLPPGAGESVGHAVLLTGVEGQRVDVIDPTTGRRGWSLAELTARWKGHAVECERAPATSPSQVLPSR